MMVSKFTNNKQNRFNILQPDDFIHYSGSMYKDAETLFTCRDNKVHQKVITGKVLTIYFV